MKVCGLSDVASVEVALAAGADAVGVVMHPPSPRHVDEATAREVVAAAAGLDTVLVVKHTPAVEAARTAVRIGASVLQLHNAAYAPDDFAAALRVLPRVWRATSPETGQTGRAKACTPGISTSRQPASAWKNRH